MVVCSAPATLHPRGVSRRAGHDMRFLKIKDVSRRNERGLRTSYCVSASHRFPVAHNNKGSPASPGAAEGRVRTGSASPLGGTRSSGPPRGSRHRAGGSFPTSPRSRPGRSWGRWDAGGGFCPAAERNPFAAPVPPGSGSGGAVMPPPPSRWCGPIKNLRKDRHSLWLGSLPLFLGRDGFNCV